MELQLWDPDGLFHNSTLVMIAQLLIGLASTKAKIIAIWTAVLATPIHINIINIFTDSQVAIDGVFKARKLLWNVQQFTKSPNSSIIEQILLIAKIKSQLLNFIKVKEYSGDPCNDLTD